MTLKLKLKYDELNFFLNRLSLAGYVIENGENPEICQFPLRLCGLRAF